MKKKIILYSLFLGISSITLSSYHTGAAYNYYDATGAEAGGTGTYANPTGCTTGNCHGTSATLTVGVAIELDSAGVPTTHYKGGMTYTVKITGTNGTSINLPKYGFQLAAMKDTLTAPTVSDAGTWASTGLPATTRLSPAVSPYTYLDVVEQSNSIAVTGGGFSKSFSWTAPVSGTGPISFWGAANFVNGNGNADAGDKWNTTKLIVNEWPVISLALDLQDCNNIVDAFPNPIRSTLFLRLENALPGNYSIGIFDLNGKMISTETITLNQGATVNVPAASWVPGLYEVVVENNHLRQIIPVVKQ